MSSLLARIARSLTQHWKRGLAGADRGRRAARCSRRRGWRGGGRLQHPGHGVPAGARPLQEAQPRLRGRRLDAGLHRRAGQDLRPRAARRGHRGARQGPRPQGRGGGPGPVRRGRDDLARRPAGLGDGPLRPRAPGAQEAGRRGAGQGGRDRRGQRRERRRARHPHRPRLRADRAGRRADRRGDRDPAADAAVPLAGGDGGHARRCADRRRRRPDPAGRAGRATRPAGVRDGDRGDARARCGHRLLALDNRPRPRTDGGGRQRARRVGEGRCHGRVLGRRGRPDRDGGDRGPARDRHPADRQARHRGGARRRGGRRVGADDPADHDRGVREAPQAEEARARQALATPSAAGARSSPRARGSRSPPACSCCSCSRHP